MTEVGALFSAVVPTMIGNAYFLPGHLLTPKEAEEVEAATQVDEMPPMTRRETAG